MPLLYATVLSLPALQLLGVFWAVWLEPFDTEFPVPQPPNPTE